MLGAVLAVSVGAVALGAILGTGDGGGKQSDGSFAEARDGLCQAAVAARDGDAARAKALFVDRSHQRLHELAAAAQDADRAATARLLEAKQVVEAGLEDTSPTLARDLQLLAAATGRAMAAAGAADPGPCPR